MKAEKAQGELQLDSNTIPPTAPVIVPRNTKEASHPWLTSDFCPAPVTPSQLPPKEKSQESPESLSLYVTAGLLPLAQQPSWESPKKLFQLPST